MAAQHDSLFDQRLMNALLEYEAEWTEGKAPPARDFAARYEDLAPVLLRELVIQEFKWLRHNGREEIVEVHLNRYPEYHDDPEVILALVRVELAYQPNRPDPDKLVQRFALLKEDVLLLLEANREAERDESAPPPGLLSRSVHSSLAAPDLTASMIGMAASADAPLTPGTTLCIEDRYRIVQLINQGGQKYVYEAHQINPGRVVALKTPRSTSAGKVMMLEGQVIAQLDHQKIPPVMSLSGPDDARPLLAEKHIPGKSWAEVLRQQRAEVTEAPADDKPRLRRQFLRENLRYLQDVCDALAYAHGELRVIHRDLKPANVMLNRFNETLRRSTEVYVVDWGLALYVGDDAAASVKAPRRAGVRGFSGTPCYAAPEMWAGAGEQLSTATDVFLLGAVLYELLTDTPPYTTTNGVRLQMLGRLGRIEAPEKRALDRTIPRELSEITRKATAADPQDRYANAAEFAQALEAWQRHADAEEHCQQAQVRREQIQAALRESDARQPTRHRFISPLIEVADQFRQAARAWEAPGQPPPADSPTYHSALEGERTTRLELADLAEQTGDFTLAEAQLERTGELPPPFNAGLTERRAALHRKARQRRRARLLLRCAAAVIAVLVAGVMGLGFILAQQHNDMLLSMAARQHAETQQQQAERLQQAESKAKTRAEELAAERQRIHKAQEWLNLAALAKEEHFDQGAALYYARALVERDDPAVRRQWKDSWQRSLVPVQYSSQRVQLGSVVYSQNGRYLLTGDAFGQGALRVWDLRDGTLVRVLPGHPMPQEATSGFAVGKLARHPSDPRRVFSAGLDGVIRCTNFLTGRLVRASVRKTPGTLAQFLALDVTAGPSGSLPLATGDSLGRLVYWNAETLQPTKVIENAHPGGVSAVALGPQGELCVTGGRDGKVQVWDRNGQPVRQLTALQKAGKPIVVNDLAISPDGKHVAVAAEALTVDVWDLHSGKKVHHLTGFETARFGGVQKDRVFRVTFLGRDELVATGMDGTVRRWNLVTGKPSPLLLRHDALLNGLRAVAPIAVRPDGKELATAGADAALRRWDAASGRLLTTLEGGQQFEKTLFGCTAAAYHPATNVLLTGGSHQIAVLRAWDPQTLREQRSYPENYSPAVNDISRWPMALAFDPSGERFAAGLLSGDLLIYDTHTGQLLHKETKTHSFPNNPIYAGMPMKPTITALAWSHDGKRLVSAGNDNRMKLWETQTYKLLHTWEAIDPERERKPRETMQQLGPTAILFERDNKHVLTGADNGFLLRWEAATGKLVTRVPGRLSAITTLAASQDGKWLATGGSAKVTQGDVVLWDAQRWQAVWTVSLEPLARTHVVSSVPRKQLEPGAVVSLCFSPDLRLLIVSQADGSLSVLDIETGAVLHRATRFGDQSANVLGLALHCFITKDRELLTAGSNGQILRWNLPPLSAAVRQPGWKTRYLAIAPDGTEWAETPTSGGLRFWDAAEVDGWRVPAPDSTPRTLDLHTSEDWPRYTTPAGLDVLDVPRSLAYTPDGTKLIVGNKYGSAAVLDRKTHRVLAVFHLPEQRRLNAITSLAVHPAGKVIASNAVPIQSQPSSRLDLWQNVDGKLLKTLEWKGRPIQTVAFRPNGDDLAALDEDGMITVWDWRTGKQRFAVQGVPAVTVRTGIVYAPGGDHFVQGGQDGQLIVFDADSGRQRQTWYGHLPMPLMFGKLAANVKCLAFSRNGLLATCATDATVRLWKRDEQGSYQPVAAISTLRMGSYRASPWNGPSANQRGPSLTTEAGELHHVVFTPDGEHLATWGHSVPIHLVRVPVALQNMHKGTPADILQETERFTGLHLVGGNLKLMERNRLVPVAAK